MNKKLLYEIIMPNFPRTVKLSDNRRAKYFKPLDKLALQYLEKDIYNPTTSPEVCHFGMDNKGNFRKLKKDLYIWKEHKLTNKKVQERLYNLIEKEYVVKNPSVAGTPNIEIINGQKMYNGDYHPHTRDKIMKEIHQYMIPFLQGLTPLKDNDYPLIIDGFMYDYGKTCEISKGKMWDVDNRSFCYNKAFQDMLQHCGIIKQDDFEHIIGPPRLIFVNLDNINLGMFIDKFPPKHFQSGLCRTLVYQIYKVCQ